jgi:GNAT superfamily N-acetyltransferase
MPSIDIRPAISSDIPHLIQFDHTVETTHVLQMESTAANGNMDIVFKETRLPRSLVLPYPKPFEFMIDSWTRHGLFLVARLDGKLVGYLILEIFADTKTGLVTDLVVDAASRRLGIASGLIISTRNWLKKKGMQRENLVAQAKNHAGITLARKLKMDYCGYQDHYYLNQDTALFFTSVLT